MTLDVVVVTHNSSALLPSALGGLPADAHVVVVDNASLDDCASLARGLGVQVVENSVNTGFGAAANQGARLGRGELLLFLNPDARVDPETVRALCRSLDDDPRLAVVSPRLRRQDGSEQRVRWPFPSAAGAWAEAFGLHRLRRPVVDGGFVIGACFMVRRSVFEALGGFDLRFWLYSEEADLCRRVREAGWRVEVVDGLVAHHVGGASGGGAEGLVFEHFERGGEHFVAKHHGPTALVAYRLANLKGSLVRALFPGSPERRGLHRARVRRLLGLLRRHPMTVRLDSPATSAPGIGLVVCSLEPWDEVWRRNQFFVRELLVRCPDRRILFVEPAYDWVHEARRRGGRVRRRGLRPLDADGRVVLVEPGKVWPGVAGPLADRSRLGQVRAAAAELGFAIPTLWVNDPAYAGLPGATGWPAVYDITDDWAEAGTSPRAAKRVRARERQLFLECSRVVVCSPGLLCSHSAIPVADDLVVVPNAVDTDLFHRPVPRPVDLPVGPVAVYVGTLHEDRLDVDLVAQLALHRPDLAVVLVGPDALSAPARARLLGAGVHLLGSRPYPEVPGYLQHADVVIVPHLVTAFTESLDPIKAYECSAVGRPTVATAVAGFRELGDPVRAVDRAGFVSAVDAVLDQGWLESSPRPVPSWADRAGAFGEVLEAARAAPPRPLSVVYVDHCAELSGGELALARVLPAVDGVDAHVVLGASGPFEAMLRAAGATVEVRALDAGVAATPRHEVTASSLGMRRVASTVFDTLALARRLRALQPDLVHTNSLKAALYGGVAARLAGTPVVWHIRDRIADDYLPAGVTRVVRALARVVPDLVIANSEATRSTLGRGVRRGTVPSRVVHDAVLQHVGSRPAIPRRFTVVMVGRLAPWKGQHVFLKAFAEAFAGGAERALVVGAAMFGDEEYGSTLPELAARLGVAEQVEFTGFVHDVGSVLDGADVLVHASVIPEPFGQVVIEGMAAGLTVIAANEGGPAEVIHDGVDGLLYPAGNVAALATMLRHVAADDALRARVGEAARARSADFAPVRVAAELRACYDQVLSGRRDG